VVEWTRDLGVLVTKDLSPLIHVNDVVSKAHERAGAIYSIVYLCVSRRQFINASFYHMVMMVE